MRAMASVRSLAVGDQLGHQRIVVGRNDAVGVGGGVDADADAAGQVEAGDAAGRGRERFGVLGVDAALDGVAAQLDGPGEDLGQRVAGGDADLALHEVDAGDELGDRVLHLDARVHLDEVEVAVVVHQELDGAGVGVADGAHGRA